MTQWASTTQIQKKANESGCNHNHATHQPICLSDLYNHRRRSVCCTAHPNIRGLAHTPGTLTAECHGAKQLSHSGTSHAAHRVRTSPRKCPSCLARCSREETSSTGDEHPATAECERTRLRRHNASRSAPRLSTKPPHSQSAGCGSRENKSCTAPPPNTPPTALPRTRPSRKATMSCNWAARGTSVAYVHRGRMQALVPSHTVRGPEAPACGVRAACAAPAGSGGRVCCGTRAHIARADRACSPRTLHASTRRLCPNQCPDQCRHQPTLTTVLQNAEEKTPAPPLSAHRARTAQRRRPACTCARPARPHRSVQKPPPHAANSGHTRTSPSKPRPRDTPQPARRAQLIRQGPSAARHSAKRLSKTSA
eukprot:3736118-Rhodomonas_salina.1